MDRPTSAVSVPFLTLLVMGIKKSDQGYVTIKTLPHYGEHAVPLGNTRQREDGETEVEVVMLNCTHGEHRIWITRKDIYVE